MQTAFQSGAFQASGFQIVADAVIAPAEPERYSGGWASYVRREQERYRDEHKRRVLRLKEEDRKRRELARQIATLEAHIAAERNVEPAIVRIESTLRDMPSLPKSARKAVRRAIRLQTIPAFERAEFVLRRLQDEEEEFAVLMAMALH